MYTEAVVIQIFQTKFVYCTLPRTPSSRNCGGRNNNYSMVFSNRISVGSDTTCARLVYLHMIIKKMNYEFLSNLQ